MKKLFFLIGSLLLLFALESNAQLSITAEVRPRTEYRNGFKKLTAEDVDAALFTEQRSRLYFDYKKDKLQLKFTLQDIRIWGETGQIFKDDNGMTAISEAWAKYNFTSKFGLKVGRQIISYDNQRFLGGLEWAQQGRRHDAALFQYEDAESKLKIHAGFAYNQSGTIAEPAKLVGTAYDVANYKTMQYLWVHKDFEGGGVSALLFNDGWAYGAALDSVSNRQTVGLVASKKIGGIKLAGEGYYQTGEFKGSEVDAYMFDLNATYKTSLTPITVGYQYLSGREATDTKITQFTPAYGTNHAHNGFMDYFYVGNAHGNVGLQDIYVKTKFKLGEKAGALIVHGHQFLGASEFTDTEGAVADASLGTEFDLVYARKLSKDVTLNVGYSQLFATESMEILKGGDSSQTQNWAWVMLTFKPQIFASK
ncbi:alginate export family protein [Sediminitomix flava]|nr:alginate export family protein [Sediminitomix flava]